MSTVSARRGEKTIDPEKVAIYIRWSTDDQSDGTTLDVQMEGCRHYALSQGWSVNEDLIYIDDGYSGGTLDRPAMSRMRKAVQDGRVDCVVVFKLDRLSRSVVDTVNLVLNEWDDLCHVKSAREPIDTTNHAGKMFFYMLVSYAEWERNVIRERTWSGRLKRAQEGRSPGINAPYGYRIGSQPGTLEIIPEEAVIVQRIYDQYTNGFGMRTIFNELNKESIPFRGGGIWNDSTIRHILTNPIYAGDLVWGRRMTNPKYGKRDGEKARLESDEPLAIKQGAFPAIVERSVWEAAQVTREQKPAAMRGTSGRAVSSRYLLTGLARCRCGSAIIGREGTGRKTHSYYICAGKNSKGSAHCDCGYINTDKVEEIAVAELKRVFGDRAKRQRVVGMLKLELQRKLEALLPEAHRLDKTLAKLGDQDKELRDQYRGKEITLQEYRSFKGDLDLELSLVTEQREGLQKQIDEARRALVNHEAWTAALSKVDEWETLNVAQKKYLLRTVCKSLTLYRTPRTSEVIFDAEWVEA